MKFIYLFLIFICFNASSVAASPVQINNSNAFAEHGLVQDGNLLASFNISSLDQKSDNDDLLILPRVIRANATEFTALAQLNPSYYLEIEFFSANVSAALYKNLVNPPLLSPWFMQVSFAGTKQRLAGWKESNSLYTARNTYHS